MSTIPGFALAAFLGILAVSVKTASFFGMDYALSSGRVVSIMAVWSLLLTCNGCLFMAHLTRRHHLLTPKTVAWIMPALHMASCYLLMFGFFFTLRWSLGEDAWSLATGLPTPFAIRVAGLLYLVTNFVILGGLFALLAYFAGHRREEGFFLDSDETATRKRVRRMSIGLILAMAALTSVLVVAFPENIHFYMAALSARNRGKVAAARDFFIAFLKKYPTGRLSDSARMMAARVMIGSFSDFTGAETLLRQVEARRGPLSDEAVFTLGRMYGFEMGLAERGEATLCRFLTEFPSNPLVDEVLVLLSDLALNQGRKEEALEFLARAARSGDGAFFLMDTAWSFRGVEDSDIIVASRRSRILHPAEGVL